MRQGFLNDLDNYTTRNLRFDWPVWARSDQCPPSGNWRTWMLLGGRGSGKTRTGAEWLNGAALGDPHYPGSSGGRVALVGTNYEDMRDVMVEGESGILAISAKDRRPTWLSSRRELIWPNGVVGKLFSSADPESLRGSQFGISWCDELVKWDELEATWDMLQFCMRLGELPRLVVTTTPKPLDLLKKIIEDPKTVTVRSRTRDNAGNLAPGFLAQVERLYGKSRLGRQELDGEIVEQVENALWSRETMETQRVRKMPSLGRIVIAVDPPASSNKSSACCGIIAAGRDDKGKCFVIGDKTIAKARPNVWAKAVADLYHALDADLVLAEVNQGGDMVRSILETQDANIPVRPVHARRGKWLRAEPVALLYEQGLVSHVGDFPELEDQMCSFGADGKSQGKSPDRLDALVWAITELALSRRTSPRVRNL